jgi:hypothetical protein
MKEEKTLPQLEYYMGSWKFLKTPLKIGCLKNGYFKGLLFLAMILPFKKGYTQDYPIQEYVYHLHSISSHEQSPIELISDDPDFAVWCLKSEFGIPKINYKKTEVRDDYKDTTIVENPTFSWNNINRPVLCKNPFSIHLTIIYNASHNYGEIVPYIKIECKDFAGNDLLKPENKASSEIRKFLQALLFQSHSYVNSSDGVNVRKQPSITAPIVASLPNYSKVIIKERTNLWMDVKRQGVTVKSEWVKVFVNENVSGFVASAFLIPFYKVHPFDIKVLNDSISSFGVVELIEFDEARNRRVISPYAIDTTSLAISLPPKKDEYYGILRGFYLPINNGADSLSFYDQPIEYGLRNYQYGGRIPIMNLYVIHSSYIFGDGVTLYDIKTGREVFNFDGLPYIAPDGGLIANNYFFLTLSPTQYAYIHRLLLVI